MSRSKTPVLVHKVHILYPSRDMKIKFRNVQAINVPCDYWLVRILTDLVCMTWLSVSLHADIVYAACCNSERMREEKREEQKSRIMSERGREVEVGKIFLAVSFSAIFSSSLSLSLFLRTECRQRRRVENEMSWENPPRNTASYVANTPESLTFIRESVGTGVRRRRRRRALPC